MDVMKNVLFRISIFVILTKHYNRVNACNNNLIKYTQKSQEILNFQIEVQYSFFYQKYQPALTKTVQAAYSISKSLNRQFP